MKSFLRFIHAKWKAFVELGMADVKPIDDNTFDPFEDISVGFTIGMTLALCQIFLWIFYLIPIICE